MNENIKYNFGRLFLDLFGKILPIIYLAACWYLIKFNIWDIDTVSFYKSFSIHVLLTSGAVVLILLTLINANMPRFMKIIIPLFVIGLLILAVCAYQNITIMECFNIILGAFKK